MKKLILLSAILIGLFTISASSQTNSGEKIKSVKTIKGKFVRFVEGDYIHPIIKTPNGKTKNYGSEIKVMFWSERTRLACNERDSVHKFVSC